MIATIFLCISILLIASIPESTATLINKPSVSDFENASIAQSYGCSILQVWAKYFDDTSVSFESVFGIDGHFFDGDSKVKLDGGSPMEGYTDIKTKFGVIRSLSNVSYDDVMNASKCELLNHVGNGTYFITVYLKDVSIGTFGNAAKPRRISYKTKFNMTSQTVLDFIVKSTGQNDGFLVPLLDASYAASARAVAAMGDWGVLDTASDDGSEAKIKMIATVLYIILGTVAVCVTVAAMCGVNWMCEWVKTSHIEDDGVPDPTVGDTAKQNVEQNV